MEIVTRSAIVRLGWLFAVLAVLVAGLWWFLARMPGRSHRGPAPAPPVDLVTELRRDVERLAGEIGERNVSRPEGLAAAADWIEAELRRAGHAPRRHGFDVRGTACANLEAEVAGGDGIVVVGAHYDSVEGSPGANDNGSGVAATLALARRFAGAAPERTLRFVFFVNEEPPFFQTDDMGSLRYARRCRERGEDVAAMISLETIGYFTSEKGSQQYPVGALSLLYGDTGDYVAFVGNVGSRGLVRDAIEKFREGARIPSKGIALFEAVPGVGWSDHWSFWQCDYPAIMVTDTAPFRYPQYHLASDRPDKLRYDGLARVVEGLVRVVRGLAGTR